MAKKQDIDLNQVMYFYDPHPGFAGAMVPIPSIVKKIADKLNGQRMSLRSALEKLQKKTKGILSVHDDFISLKIGGGGMTHMFCVIRFRPQ